MSTRFSWAKIIQRHGSLPPEALPAAAVLAERTEEARTSYSLAFTLYNQQKYPEAEQLFREVAKRREKVLGKEHLDTLKSKYRLARTLFEQKQQKYPEAEQLFREVAQRREKVLGKEHPDTLNSKYWLARTLFEQKKYHEAEELIQKSIPIEEKVLGAKHKDTIKSRSLLQKVQLAITQTSSVNSSMEKKVVSRLSDFFVQGKDVRAQYTDSEIGQISLLLAQLNPQWSKVPRTYITLRNIGCLDLLDKFIDIGFSDHWFPVTERNLPQCLQQSHRLEFVNAQELVMTNSLDLEKGEEGQHCYFRRDNPLPFELDQLQSLRTKTGSPKAFGGRGAEDVKRFIAEIEILKHLKHRHIVKFVGSYTDSRYMGLIMYPVADMDLSTYLNQADTAKHGELRTFFGCLARALEFLHEQNIRHKDVKPGNILVHRGTVLFTDFGLSLDFADAEGSTTVSMINGMTPKYCAPEVVMHEPRNTSSDIWSLGIVYLEMIVVLKSRTVEYIAEFLVGHGSQQAYVRANPEGFVGLIAELREAGSASDNIALAWVQNMLITQPRLRPTAASLVTSIIASGSKDGIGHGAFCGICCISHDDDFSDDLDEFE